MSYKIMYDKGFWDRTFWLFKYIRDGDFAEDIYRGWSGYVRLRKAYNIGTEFERTVYYGNTAFYYWPGQESIRRTCRNYLWHGAYNGIRSPTRNNFRNFMHWNRWAVSRWIDDRFLT